MPFIEFDHTQTATQWDSHRRNFQRPTHAARRGLHLLPHQCQQVGRDLEGERYAQRPTFLVYYRDEEARAWAEKNGCDPRYRWIVQTASAQAVTAFRSADELLAWICAYAVDFQPAPVGARYTATATPGDPANWQPLTIEPLK